MGVLHPHVASLALIQTISLLRKALSMGSPIMQIATRHRNFSVTKP